LKYLSKLLLFGEYTIINGSRALAVPYDRYFGEWVKAEEPDARLLGLAGYLDRNEGPDFLNVTAFRTACREGWGFRSNIPLGYGLGSSGALCAAVYDRFAIAPVLRTDTAAFTELKRQLAWMESYFHGSSSGTDPLISYLNFPVLIHPQEGIREVAVPSMENNPYHFFLLDTGISRSTGPLVDLYLEKCKEEEYATRIATGFVPVVNQLIDAYLQGRWPEVYDHMRSVSAFQWQHFPEMIPEAVRVVWERGLEQDRYVLKLCGAGGGGFLLGISKSKEAIEDLDRDFSCHFLP
jgi:mevalonate kinase